MDKSNITLEKLQAEKDADKKIALEGNRKPAPKFWGRSVKPAPAAKSRKAKAERRARYERVHIIQGKAGDIVTIGGTRYKIAPAGNIVKVQ